MMADDQTIDALQQENNRLRLRVAELEQQATPDPARPSITVLGVPIEWQLDEGICTFQGAAVSTMFIAPTLAGLMSGFQKMVGTRRFFLAMQSEGRSNIDIDWQIIQSQPDFEQGFAAWSNFPILAGWGRWEILSLSREQKQCRIRIHNSFEGLYQQSLGVDWGSGIAAGKCAGIFSLLFETDCWAEQTASMARGDAYDEFLVQPSTRSLEQEIDSLLDSNEATRADLAVALQQLQEEMQQREQVTDDLRLFRVALDNIADGVRWLDAEGRCIYVNHALCRSLGYTREELLQMTVDQLDPDITMQQWHDEIWPTMKQQGSMIVETRHWRKDGSIVPVEVTSTYIAFQEKEYLMTFIRDISESKQRETERAALHQQVIDAQRDALRELSTPLIPISDEVVIMPLIGTIDSQRAQQVMEALLEGVARHQASLVILDITGVSVVDTQVAQAFIQAAQAVRLLGAQVMLTGIQPQIAQTLVHLGVDLSGIQTQGSLQAGIAAALTRRQHT
jgi:anti-anti-sigma factor